MHTKKQWLNIFFWIDITADVFKEIKLLSVLWCKQQQDILSSSVSYFSRKQDYVLKFN